SSSTPPAISTASSSRCAGRPRATRLGVGTRSLPTSTEADMHARTHITTRSRSSGLTIIEILVGVAIGLIGIVAIFQAVAVWSKHTASTSSGGDAQVAGTLALFNIERDIKQAGHGFGRAQTPVMGCNVAEGDFTDATATTKKLRRRGGFKPGDVVVAAVNPGASAATASCQLIQI